MPIVLTRTPYNAKSRAAGIPSPDIAMVLPAADEDLVRDGYIRVYQDVRGRFASKGRYTMTMPVRGSLQRGGGRPGHRRLGHGGVAGGERGGQQRPRRHDRHLLRRPPHPHGPPRPAPGAEGGGPRQLHGRLLARRRLLPPRGLPHGHVPVHLPADLDEGRQPLRPLGIPRPLPSRPRGRLPRRAGPPLRGRPAAGLEAPPGASGVRRLLEGPGPAGAPRQGAAAGARAQRPQPLRRRGPLRRGAQPRGHGPQRPPGDAHAPGHRPLVPRPDLGRGLATRQPQVGGGHLPALPPGYAQALLRPPPQEEEAGRAAAAGDRLRDREQLLAAVSALAAEEADRGPAALPAARGRPLLRGARRRGEPHRVHLRPGQAGALPGAAHRPALRRGRHLVPVAGRRPAPLLRPHRRPRLRQRATAGTSHRVRRAVGHPLRLDHRDRRRLGRQAHRPLPRRGPRGPGHGRLPADDLGGHPAGPLPRELREGGTDPRPGRCCPTESSCPR